jgi:hypothetical protein
MTGPSPDRQPPKYRHQKARNLAVVRIDGRDIYLGRFNSPESHEKYRRCIAEWYSAGIISPIQKPGVGSGAESGLTVNEAVLAFMRHANDF